MKITGVGTVMAAFVAFSGVMLERAALAQDNTDGNPANDGMDPRPEPPRPIIADPTSPPIRQQAGIGGDVAFAHAGVVELGGSAGLLIASDLTTFNLSPSVGYFIADNVQLSLLSGVTYAKAKGVDGSSFAHLLLEPSYHLPFSDSLFGFVGIGFGATYAEAVDLGFAVAPRIGAKFMVGRSGILTPSISWMYSTNDIAAVGAPAAGGTASGTVQVSGAAIFNIGYTVML